MDKNKAWEIFASTGKIQDYLNFKSVSESNNSPLDHNNANKKNKNRRTDNKATEYR